MTITTTLNDRLHAAADYLHDVGWTQGTFRAYDGRVCATGAVMYCRPKDGDEHLIREVLRRRNRAENWNDQDERTAAEVEAALRVDITDAELAEVFGPQWEAVVALVRRAARLTADEGWALVAASGAGRSVARAVAWDAARDAACDLDDARDLAPADYAAWNAPGDLDAARDAEGAARDATRNAAWALVVRDLIGSHGFTQADYDTLTGPWATVIGPVHPDDAERERVDA